MRVQQIAVKSKIHSILPHVHANKSEVENEQVVDSSNSRASLVSRLQTTLDPEEILKIFSESLKNTISHDGLIFISNDRLVNHSEGNPEKSKLFYGLSHEGCKVGDITITRRRRFSKVEISQVEEYIAFLFYPLRNALLYNQALISALRDPLTKLNNRTMLDQTLSRESLIVSRHSEDFSMIIIDVDEFKRVNDDFGHQAGDAVLCRIADIMREFGRSSDMLFRFAGDEFIITLSKTDNTGAQMVANRIRDAVDRATFEYDEKKLPVSVSMGVATLRKDETTSQLFTRADEALYVAKANGRNQVCVESVAG